MEWEFRHHIQPRHVGIAASQARLGKISTITKIFWCRI